MPPKQNEISIIDVRGGKEYLFNNIEVLGYCENGKTNIGGWARRNKCDIYYTWVDAISVMHPDVIFEIAQEDGVPCCKPLGNEETMVELAPMHSKAKSVVRNIGNIIARNGKTTIGELIEMFSKIKEKYTMLGYTNIVVGQCDHDIYNDYQEIIILGTRMETMEETKKRLGE